MKRLAASFEVAGRDLGFAPEDRRAIVTACVREYRAGMRKAATKGTLDVWYSHLNIDELTAWMDAEVSEKRLGKKDETGAARTIAKARTRNSVRVFSKRTGLVGGELRIVRDPPLITPIEDVVLSRPERAETEKSIAQLLRSPGQERHLRSGHRGLLRRLCRPERAGLRGASLGREVGAAPSADRPVGKSSRVRSLDDSRVWVGLPYFLVSQG